MTTRLHTRLARLEGRRTPDAAPWVQLVWHRGDPRPEPPPGHNAIVRKIIAPGDPLEWRPL